MTDRDLTLLDRRCFNARQIEYTDAWRLYDPETGSGWERLRQHAWLLHTACQLYTARKGCPGCR